MEKLTLYSYFRSSASFRVRSALNYKGIDYDYHPVHLTRDGGEQHLEGFKKLNPIGEVPCIVHEGKVLAQSMAIIVYLEDLKAKPALFPVKPIDKAKVIQLCEIVNSGIHPVQNLKVLQTLEKKFGMDQEGKNEWARLWIEKGFTALERELASLSGQFSFGDSITAADCFILPQIFNARRFSLPLEPFPILSRIEKNLLAVDSFKKAAPANQPDKE